MRSILGLILIGMMIFAMVACGGTTNAPEEPVADAMSTVAMVATAVEVTALEATTPPIEPAASVPPPTVEPTLEPTAEPPTATPEPTAKPTKEPPPEISLATIAGMFTQFDVQAGGNNWLLFNEDGTFVARHGPAFDTGVAVTEGTYVLEGNVLTLVMPEECPDGERYELRFATRSQLHFDVVDTSCNAFADDFERQPNWKHVDE